MEESDEDEDYRAALKEFKDSQLDSLEDKVKTERAQQEMRRLMEKKKHKNKKFHHEHDDSEDLTP